MESSSEAENVEGRLGVILGQRGQIQTDSRMEVKLGGWSRRPMRKLLKVSSRSPGVIQDQMAYHCCMDLKLGGWSHLLMPTFLGVAQGPMGLSLLYGHESWWIEPSVNAKMLKVSSRSPGSHSRSNG